MGMVKCMKCGVVLESTSRHDFVKCKCSNETFVDGGNDYMRVGGKDLAKISVFDSIRGIWKPAAGNGYETTPEEIVKNSNKRVIWKFKVDMDSYIDMPVGAKILDVQKQHDEIMMWAMVDPQANLERRFFTVIMTGEEFSENGVMFYVGTVTDIRGWLVGHVFEVRN